MFLFSSSYPIEVSICRHLVVLTKWFSHIHWQSRCQWLHHIQGSIKIVLFFHLYWCDYSALIYVQSELCGWMCFPEMLWHCGSLNRLQFFWRKKTLHRVKPAKLHITQRRRYCKLRGETRTVKLTGGQMWHSHRFLIRNRHHQFISFFNPHMNWVHQRRVFGKWRLLCRFFSNV